MTSHHVRRTGAKYCFVVLVIVFVVTMAFFLNVVPSLKADIFVFEPLKPPPPAQANIPTPFPNKEMLLAQGKEGRQRPSHGKGDERREKRTRVFDMNTDCQQLISTGYLEDEDDVTLLSPLTTNDTVLVDQWHRMKISGAKTGVSIRREVLEHPKESRLLCSLPAATLEELPDLNKSQVSIVDGKDSYTIGDEFKIRLDLFDGRGRRRASGGDEVRMWLRSPKGDNAVPVRVLDLGNGSYVGVTELMFGGVTLVRASLTYPREFLRWSVELRHKFHCLRWIFGVFKNRNITEKTPCLPYLPIPGYATVCNLTKENAGAPWFCGRPAQSGLNCSHWKLTEKSWWLDTTVLKDVTMNTLERQINGPPTIRLVPNNLTVFTSKATSKEKQSSPPCWSIPREQTWTRPTPRGWLEGGAWRERGCTLPSSLSSEYVAKCLRNTGLLLLGDSNQRIFNQMITAKLQSHPLLNSECASSWPHATRCQFPELNSTLTCSPHARPLHTLSVSWESRSVLDEVDLLLTSGRQTNVLVLHYYLHLTFDPIYLYRFRVQYARRVIEQVLTLRPQVKVMIRGPHVLYLGSEHHLHFGDNFATWYTQIWKEEFWHLRDKVWFLDVWDLSVAMENPTSHPAPPIALQMLKTMFGYICEM